MKQKNSRTFKSFRNSFVALAFSLLNLALQFFSRKVFLEFLGTEILGLNTTAMSILQFLNIAEMGISSAIAVTLYTPLYEKDYSKINEIVNLFGWFYKKVALFIIAGSAILMLFFPLIFAKVELPLWYAYASYSVLLFSALLGYFVNYKQVLLTASQQDYKIQFSYRLPLMVKVAFQIAAMYLVEERYICWLLLEVGFAIISAILLRKSVETAFPYLKKINIPGQELKEKYKNIVVKIKQVFVQKMAAFVLSQSSPIIVYAFSSMTIVALYGNYLIVITGLTILLNAAFNSISAGIGNLVAEKNKERICLVFRELFVVRFSIVALCSVCMFYLINPLVTLWIGANYLLDQKIVLILSFTFFFNSSRTIVDSFLQAYGMFWDVWASILEAFLNLSVSILLGSIWGLKGILMGALISLILVIHIWKPYFLFRYGMKVCVRSYVRLFLKNVVILFVSLFCLQTILCFLPVLLPETICDFVMYSAKIVVPFSILYFGILMVIEPGMRSFAKRVILLFGKKGDEKNENDW